MRRFLLPPMILLGAFSIAQAGTITLNTEEYAPFSFREEGEIKGANVDQLRRMMTATGLEYKIDIMPWARAYAEAQTGPMTCVFATAHTPERNDLFKWVEPLMIGRNVLIKHTGGSVTASNLEEAKAYSIGTWRGDYSETVLRNLKFPRIDVSTDFKAVLKKLLSDRIDLMPISDVYFDRLKQEGQPVEQVAVLSALPIGIACNKDFPEPLLNKMQSALDTLIADGTQKKIFREYGMQLEN